jgi:phage FluMu protein Com
MTDARDEDPVERHVVDGNALAGELERIFGADMTSVPGQCAHCGTVSAVAQLRAYVQAPGKVLRCPACSGVVIRIVETPDATYVDARGAAYLRIDWR